jgi:hypothetical protein
MVVEIPVAVAMVKCVTAVISVWRARPVPTYVVMLNAVKFAVSLVALIMVYVAKAWFVT